MLPFAFVVGAVGCTIESFYRNTSENPPYFESIQQKREERFIEELSSMKGDDFSKLKEKKFVPKTIFERNISPNLLEHEK